MPLSVIARQEHHGLSNGNYHPPNVVSCPLTAGIEGVSNHEIQIHQNKQICPLGEEKRAAVDIDVYLEEHLKCLLEVIIYWKVVHVQL